MRSSYIVGFILGLLIFLLSSNNISGQYPSRSLFNILFENDFNDNQLGSYLSSDYAKDWNKPAHTTIDVTKKIEILEDNTAGTPFMRVFFKKDTYGLTGNGCYWTSTLPACTEVYFSYDVRFKPGFEWVIGGKIPGVIGGNTQAGVAPKPGDGFSARIMWKENGRAVSYVYHQDQAIQYGDSFFWGNFAFTSGKWYNITIRVVLNSPASKNGIMEGFVDGKLMFQKTNFRFRAIESIKIENMSISSFFGGDSKDWAALRDEWIDFDNFIAFTYTSELPNVPKGNQASSSEKELIHPYRPIPDASWKKSLKSGNTTLTEITLNWDEYPVPMSYILERKDASATEFVKVATISYGNRTYTDKNLQADKSFSYRLTAGSSVTNTLTTSTRSPVLPNAPAALVISGITKTGLKLSWTDNSSNESGFRIERSQSAEGSFTEIAATTASVTSFNDNNLTPGSTYYYRIRAYNSDGYSAYTSMVQATTIALQIPDTPGSLIASQINYTWATLLWKDNSDNEKGFELERSGPGDLTTKTVISLSAGTTSYTDKELVMDGSYQYRIRAINDDGRSAWSNTINLVTPVLLPPAAPTKLKSTKFTDKSISVRWDDNSDNEDAFIITRSLASDLNSSVDIELGPNDTTYTDTSLMASTTYLYTVKAVNIAGSSSNSNKNVATTLSQAELKRINTGLIAYYNFGYNPDFIVYDQSGFGEPLNLHVIDRNAVVWNEDNNLDILGNTALVSINPAKKITSAILQSNEVSFELWLKPRQPDSYSNARIVSLGNSNDDAGFILDQQSQSDVYGQKLNYSIRMQTSSTLKSGYPEYTPELDIPFLSMEHIVYTRDKSGNESFYLNGVPCSGNLRPNDLNTWKSDYYLRIGNESDMNFPWNGRLYSVAIYGMALSLDEVLTNYKAGACDKIREEEIKYTIKVSPNPANDHALLEITPENLSDITAPAFVSLIDAYGTVLINYTIFNPYSQFTKYLDLRHYPPGIYFIRLTSGKRQKKTKIIITR